MACTNSALKVNSVWTSYLAVAAVAEVDALRPTAENAADIPGLVKQMLPQREHIQAVLASAGLTLREVGRQAGGLSGTVLALATDQGDFILKVS